MNADDPNERPTPAEQRLDQYLRLLRDVPPPPADLTHRVIRAARWQQAVRSPLLAAAQFVEAAVEAVRLLVGGRRS